MRVPLLAGLVVALACNSTDSPNPDDAAVGLWRVTAVNGAPVPAVTESSDTFFAGYLALAASPLGSLTFCAGFGPDARQEFFDRITWGMVDDTHLRFSYPDFTGAEMPVDTAALNTAGMHWHAKVAEPRLGTSEWDLVRVSTTPVSTSPPTCP